MPSPILALYTDFGEGDAYVGMLKGKLLRYLPQARLVDVSHQIARHSIFDAGFMLRRVYPYYPAGTIHLVGIDSGTGKNRVLAARVGGQIMLGPDNGVLSLALADQAAAVHAVPVSPEVTFVARDVLVPLAARLAAREAMATLGPAIEDWERIELPQPAPLAPAEGGGLRGQILAVDGFGNLIANFTRAASEAATLAELDGVPIDRWCSGYADAPTDAGPFLRWGSEGWLEISCWRASAAERLRAQVGSIVILR